jgi:aminomethyltransferase
MLVVNASNIDKTWNWMEKHNDLGVEMSNRSDATALLAVQGPKATEALQPLTEVPLDSIAFYHFERGTFAGVEDVIISATGYTGAGGFELYIHAEKAVHVWNQIMETGAGVDIQPVGLGARDTLRLEMGYCLYGNDIDDTTNPIEAGLGWITKPETGFIAADIIQKVKEAKPDRRLVGFEMLERGIPRKGYEICDDAGKRIGTVTSGTQSPSLNQFIGMGYVAVPMHQSGTEIWVNIRNKPIKAQVVKMPFYKA